MRYFSDAFLRTADKYERGFFNAKTLNETGECLSNIGAEKPVKMVG